jgi:Uma2 family endonuclease
MQLVEPKTRRWNRAEFYQMADLGWFNDQRVELIEGEIIEMPPIGNPHCICTDRVAESLRTVFHPGCWVRMQMPLNLNPYSEPLPDVAVVAGARDQYTDHPTTALLVVEVSDTTLSYDRRRKASLYARTAIADYWIVNLVDRQLEVHRDPAADSTQAYGFGYANPLLILGPADLVTPLAAPHARIPVTNLLP